MSVAKQTPPVAGAPANKPKSMLSIQDILDQMDEVAERPIDVGDLAPLSSPAAIRRSKRTMPIPDMTTLSKLIVLIGEGNTGKTLTARWLVEMLSEERRKLVAVATLAQGNRNLIDFAPGAMQPPNVDAKDTAAWALRLMTAMERAGSNGIWDFGGGDSSFRHMIAARPDMVAETEERGLAIVPFYLLSPRIGDLVFLKAFEGLGFQPRATALVLNMGKAASPKAFDDLRRAPAYRAALDRGAVEVWLPALSQSVALAIEAAKVTFGQAADNTAPEGRDPAFLGFVERIEVRAWMEDVKAELAPIASWMPWS